MKILKEQLDLVCIISGEVIDKGITNVNIRNINNLSSQIINSLMEKASINYYQMVKKCKGEGYLNSLYNEFKLGEFVVEEALHPVQTGANNIFYKVYA